jgi:hypothetical protein
MYLSANDRVTHNARRQDKRSVPKVPFEAYISHAPNLGTTAGASP